MVLASFITSEKRVVVAGPISNPFHESGISLTGTTFVSTLLAISLATTQSTGR